MTSNKAILEIEARSENVSLARVVATAFITTLDPTVNELSDIKTAVSEAVTNAIIHGYGEPLNQSAQTIQSVQTVIMHLSFEDKDEGKKITIEISDKGVGIENIESAREPLFTTKPEMERSGLGFTVMESFMDEVEVKSTQGVGTTVIMTKTLKEQ
jgi:stage II sporulation protein AB (anti-sigma F factor)